MSQENHFIDSYIYYKEYFCLRNNYFSLYDINDHLSLFFFLLCAICCQFLWIVHFWLLIRYSLTFICQFLWIVHFWWPLRYSLTFICQFLWIVHLWLPIRYSLRSCLCPLVFLLRTTFILILSNILTLSVPDEGYSRNT
jgi:hypothetical protein